MPFPYDDLRTFLDDCEKEGMVVRVQEEVDWNLEAGAINRRLAEMGKGKGIKEGGTPAVIFENVKGYPKGFRLATHMMGAIDRIAKAYGYDYKGKTSSEIKAGLTEVCAKAMKNPIKPVTVDKKDALCKQNIMMGDDIDVLKFPVPFIHEGDGGRYAVTWAYMVTKALDSDWVNWGIYRGMVHDGKTLGGLLEERQHIGLHWQKYAAKGIPMPIAIVIGGDPISFGVGSAGIAPGVSEVDVEGGVRGKPVRLVKCETSDLLVPADAEIVIEVEAIPGDVKEEGPYGEYTGYMGGVPEKRQVYHIKAITYRNDPIFTFQSTGAPVQDFAATFFTSAQANEILARIGIQARTYLMPETGFTMMMVALKNQSPNVATMVKNCLTSQMGLMSVWTFKFLIVADDVDIYDPGQCLWAISTRCHPRRGLIVSDEICGPLTPFASVEERRGRNAPHLTFDCMFPLAWRAVPGSTPTVSGFTTIYPKDIQEKVIQKWEKYGLKVV